MLAHPETDVVFMPSDKNKLGQRKLTAGDLPKEQSTE